MKTDWTPREDSRPGTHAAPFSTLEATIHTWLIDLEWPTKAVARFTLREYWDGTVGTVQGCVWTADDMEGDA